MVTGAVLPAREKTAAVPKDRTVFWVHLPVMGGGCLSDYLIVLDAGGNC